MKLRRSGEIYLLQINRLRHLKEHVDEDHKPHGPLPPQRPAVEELKVNITHNNTIHALSNPDHHTNKANQYIRYNYRPSQPLYERKVYCSHPSMVQHTSYFPEFSVGDIAVNHHVSNLGDHDLSKALLQDTGSGFHHAIGSSLSSHPHDSHSSRSTLNIHSHGSDLPPQKVGIDFNGRNSKQQRITDALPGHPDEFLNKVLPKDLEDILTRNHIPNFEHKLEQSDIYKIFGNIFLRQAQILSAQKTIENSSKVDTKLFTEPEMKEYSNPAYRINKIQHDIKQHNFHSKNKPQQQKSQNSSKHLAFRPKEQVISKPFGDDLPKYHNQNAIKHHQQDAQNTVRHVDNAANQPAKERLSDYKMVNSNKKSSTSFNLSGERPNTYSARRRGKLGSGGFHFFARKPSYQQHGGEISNNYPPSSLPEKKNSIKFISKPYAKHYRSSASVEKSKTKVDVPNKNSEKGILHLISHNSFDVLESETILKTRKALAAFVKSAPKVSDSPGFSTKRTSSVLLETLGLEKPAPFEETVNDGLSNLKTETAAEREKTTQTTTNVDMTPFSTSPTTQSPEIVTSAIPPESYEPVKTTLGNEKVRFPIQRERNAPSIPIRSMLDGYKNMLPMLTNPSPSKDQKPYLPL